jgi:ABC-2 type transport system permease protein
MKAFLRSAFVIGRRDFVATVYTRTFLVFLAGPLIILGISFIFGNVVEKSARRDTRSAVAVVANEAGFAARSHPRRAGLRSVAAGREAARFEGQEGRRRADRRPRQTDADRLDPGR